MAVNQETKLYYEQAFRFKTDKDVSENRDCYCLYRVHHQLLLHQSQLFEHCHQDKLYNAVNSGTAFAFLYAALQLEVSVHITKVRRPKNCFLAMVQNTYTGQLPEPGILTTRQCLSRRKIKKRT
jgi:hypothetical protein